MPTDVVVPRYLYPVVATSAVVGALALLLIALTSMREPVGRWVGVPDQHGYLDTRTGTLCGISEATRELNCRSIAGTPRR